MSPQSNSAVTNIVKASKANPKIGRPYGARNYNAEKVYEAVKEVMPVDLKMWKEVASKYQQLSGDGFPRKADNIRTFWWQTMCGNGRVPTGKKAVDIVIRSQELQNKIMEGVSAREVGADSDEDYDVAGFDVFEDEDDNVDAEMEEIVASIDKLAESLINKKKEEADLLRQITLLMMQFILQQVA